MRMWKRRENTHRSRGRLEDLRLVAWVTADTTDWSILCAAQMEEIDSSKEVGSSRSAGIKLFKRFIVLFESEVEWMDIGSGSSNGDV